MVAGSHLPSPYTHEDIVNFPSRFVSLIFVAASVASCQSAQPVPYLGLDSRLSLKPNMDDSSGRIPYSYRSPVAWNTYRSAIIEPVVIYRGSDNQFGTISEGDRQFLAKFMQQEFEKRLSTRFSLVTAKAPQTIRIRLTLAGAKTTTPVVGAVTKVDLMGGPYNAVQAARGKEGMFSGSVNYAVEIYDAQTNKLLAAYVAKQYPSAMNLRTGWTSLDASMVGISKGADALLAELSRS